MPEQLLSSKTAAQKAADLAAVAKATGVKSYASPAWSSTPVKPATGKDAWGQQTGKPAWTPGQPATQPPGRDVTGEQGAFFSDGPADQSGWNYTRGNAAPAPTPTPVPAAGGVDGSAPVNPMSAASATRTAQAQIKPGTAQTMEGQIETTSQPNLQPTVQPQTGFREQDLNSVGQKFYSSLGAHENFVKQKIADFETQTGKQVAINSRAFQSQLKSSLGNQTRWDPIFQRFAHTSDYSTSSAPQDSSQTRTQSSINTPMVLQEQTTQDKISTVISTSGEDTWQSQLEQLLAMPPETPPETLIRNMLMLQIGALDDSATNHILDSQESRAIEAYKTGLALVNKGNYEIDQAIEGTLDTATTTEGLLAKVQYEGKEETLSEITAQKDYYQKRSDLQLDDMRAKRADLVGYAKAKLYQMGAEDSSAGVALIGKIATEADLQINLAQMDANEQIRQLDAQAKTTIRDFTNNVSGIVMDQKNKETQLAIDYEDSLVAIDEQRLTSEQDKRKQTLVAYSDYMKNIMDYREKAADQKRDALNDAYNRMKDAQDNAFKLSGLMGTIFYADETGALVDTGVSTFEAKKYAGTNYLDTMRLQLSMDQNRQNVAKTLLDTYGSAASPYMESALGLPSGSLSGLKTQDELKYALELMKEGLISTMSGVQADYDTTNGKALQAYQESGGGVKRNGIGVDPFSLPDVRETIQGLSYVTQTWHATGTGGTDKGGGHGGIDYVSKDGYSRAVRGGEVVEVIPWDGNSPYGNQVRIMDETGMVWQYSHMGNRAVDGDYPFEVKVGDIVSDGDVLGREGNTGNIITSKKGNLAGRHTDLRIVGRIDLSNLNTETPAPTETADPEQLIQAFSLKTGRVATQEERKQIRLGGQEAFDRLSETTDEKNARAEQEKMQKVVDMSPALISGWVKSMTPQEIQTLAPWAFQGLPVSLEDLNDKYVKTFKAMPSAADLKLLEQYGLEGLQMIMQREEEKKKSSTGLTIS